MRLDKDHAGSGSLSVDTYRTERGLAAAGALSAGFGYRCVVGDHVGSETCVETITHASNNPAKMAGSDASAVSVIAKAVDNLKAGIGVHKVAANHAGGNTCVAVIAAAV